MQSSLPPNLGSFTLGEIISIQNNTHITKIFSQIFPFFVPENVKTESHQLS